MKTNLRKFAPYGLYLALLAALVSGGLYLVHRSFDLPLQISLALIIIGLALYVLFDPAHVKQLLTGRQARYGSNSLVLALAFIGILVVINFFFLKNSVRWDLTEDKQHTLAKETIDTLNSLTQPVKAEGFFTSRLDSTSAKNLLDDFKRNSGGKFDYEMIDPEKDPVRAQQDKVTRDGTVVVKQGERMEPISFTSETDLTNALVRLQNPGKRTVYFLTGHGEYNPDDTSAQSYSLAKKALTAKNYTVNVLNLISTREIPQDALALIIPGATKPISQEEVDLVKAYLDKGGSLVLLSEPRPVTQFGDAPDLMAAYLQKSWGISLDEDMVIDPNINPPSVAASATYGKHPITEKMYNQAILLPSARSITPSQAQETISSTILAQTAAKAWGETDYQSLTNQKVTFDQKDVPGPVDLAIAATNDTSKARLVVMGDSDFATDTYFNQYGNGDFLMNSIDWAAQQENLISLTSKQTTQRFLVIPSQFTMGLVLLGVVFILPGAIIISGISTWLRRRKKG